MRLFDGIENYSTRVDMMFLELFIILHYLREYSEDGAPTIVRTSTFSHTGLHIDFPKPSKELSSSSVSNQINQFNNNNNKERRSTYRTLFICIRK